MKKRVLLSVVSVSFMLMFQACGGSDNSVTNDDNKQESVEKSLLTKDNYLSLARYHFSKETTKLKKPEDTSSKSIRKFRTYPGAKGEDVNPNALRIFTVSPFNKYIEMMEIVYKDEKVVVEVKNRLYVVVTFYKLGEVVETQKLTMNEFTNFDLYEKGEL